MRSLMALSLLLLSTTGVMSAEFKATSRIEAVTVYPAGAEVTRAGRLTMDGGEHVILFTDLPAQAVPGSIRVEGRATGALQIGSVDTRRVSVPRTDEAIAATERKQIEDAIERLKDERAVLQAAVEAAQAQKALVNNLAQLPTQPPSPHAAGPQPDWSQLFTLIGQRVAEAQKTILEAQIKMRETDRQIADLTRKLSTLAPAPEQRTEVKVFVSATGALDADLIIRYQVGAASWTPFYDARLATGTRDQAPRLQLVRRASIQQRTGENWDEVQLSLSTARPNAGSAAPDLRPVMVDYAPDAPQPQQAPAAGRGRGAQEGHFQLRSAAPGNDRTVLQAGRYAANERPASVEAQPFQAVYAIAGRVAVPSTGEMKRVQIDDMTLDPTLTVRTVPKAEAKAYLYAKLTMAAGTTVLPGPVALFRDSIFVGNGQLPLLAPGEEHELGFGVDDMIRVRHAIAEQTRGESGWVSTSKTDVRNYRITVKNMHQRPIQLRVLDQIPVSQNEAIKIDLLGRTQPTRRNVDDKRGVLAWDMTLAPDEEKAVEFGYRVKLAGGEDGHLCAGLVSGPASIRSATPDDADRIRAIARAAYVKYVARIGREPAPMVADFAALIAADYVIVAEDREGIKGYMIGWPETDAYFIDNIAVDPEYQGQGLGRYLIEHAATEAKHLRLPAVRLYTNVAMTENLAMYAHIGFVETHRAMEHGFQRIYLRWELDDHRQNT